MLITNVLAGPLIDSYSDLSRVAEYVDHAVLYAIKTSQNLTIRNVCQSAGDETAILIGA